MLEVGQGDIVASSNVQVANSIVHQGDSNTKIEFDTDQILMRAGNTKFLEVNSNGVVHTPFGISGGGATFGSKGITSSGPIFVDNASWLTKLNYIKFSCDNNFFIFHLKFN